MVARTKDEWSRLSLSRQIRVDREVYEALVQRMAERQAASGRRRVSFNEVLREVLLPQDSSRSKPAS